MDRRIALKNLVAVGARLYTREDKRYFMFSSRSPRNLAFHPHWLTNSDNTNPTMHRYKDKYLLFYTCTTYSGDLHMVANPTIINPPKMLKARANQRIGLAIASSPAGPWIRQDKLILEPCPGKRDALMTTDAAPCVGKDGSIMLIYKSTVASRTCYGWELKLPVALMPLLNARLMSLFLISIENHDHVEDGYLWQQNGKYNLLMKDMNGGLSGETYTGVHATSADGKRCELSQSAKAYSRKLDGATAILLFKAASNVPNCLFRMANQHTYSLLQEMAPAVLKI